MIILTNETDDDDLYSPGCNESLGNKSYVSRAWRATINRLQM